MHMNFCSILFSLFCFFHSAIAADTNNLPATLDTQVILVDDIITHTEDFHGLRAKPEAPRNWISPVDYVGGTYHIQYEVMEKANAIPLQIDFCIGKNDAADVNHRRSIRTQSIITTGIYEVNGRIETDWDLRGNAKEWDWSNAFAGGLWTDGIPSTITPPPYPIKVHVTVTIVAKGATYNANGQFGPLDVRHIIILKPIAEALSKGLIGPALAAVLKEDERLKELQRRTNLKTEPLTVADPSTSGSSTKIINPSDFDPARLDEINYVIDGLCQYAESRRNELRTIKDASPEFAVDMLIKLGRQYQPTSLGDDLLAEAKRWNDEPAVKSARESRLLYESIAHRAGHLQDRQANFSEVATANRYADDLKFLLLSARKLKTDYPDSNAYRATLALFKTLAIPPEWLDRELAR